MRKLTNTPSPKGFQSPKFSDSRLLSPRTKALLFGRPSPKISDFENPSDSSCLFVCLLVCLFVCFCHKMLKCLYLVSEFKTTEKAEQVLKTYQMKN
jgi:hypothetical protein